jgi:hypothetical protein
MSSSPAGVFQRRKAYLSLALRRARSGSGSSRNFLRTRLWKGTPVTLDLAQLHTPFAVVGGVATRLYMSFRVTLDLDLFVTASEAPALDHELWQLGCTQEGALGVGGTTWRTAAGEPLVAWLGQEPWAAEAVEQPNRARWLAGNCPALFRLAETCRQPGARHRRPQPDAWRGR